MKGLKTTAVTKVVLQMGSSNFIINMKKLNKCKLYNESYKCTISRCHSDDVPNVQDWRPVLKDIEYRERITLLNGESLSRRTDKGVYGSIRILRGHIIVHERTRWTTLITIPMRARTQICFLWRPQKTSAISIPVGIMLCINRHSA